MANPGLLLKGAKMLAKTPAGKKAKKKTYDFVTGMTKKSKKYVQSKYKKGDKGPGATTRTTKPAEVTKSYGQAQRSTDNMFGNDKLTRDAYRDAYKVLTKPIK